MWASFREFIDTKKGMRRLMVASWVPLIVFATLMTFTSVEIAEATSTQFQVLIGVSGGINAYYFKKRSED